MPYVERNGTPSGPVLYYETDGDGETVVFVEDLGYGAWLWSWQHGAVTSGPFESLVWDLRGTGRSDTPEGPYDLDTLAADLEAVLADSGSRRAHLVGMGLGGLVALQYALEFDRARSLSLVGTSAGGQHVPEDPVARLFAPHDDEAELRETLEPVLGEAFRQRQPEVVDGIVQWRAGARHEVADEADVPEQADVLAESGEVVDGDATGDGWRAQAAAIEGVDLHDRLHEITVPALVVHGGDDAVWPPAGGERLAGGLPDSRHVEVDEAAHLVNVERSRTANDHLVGFLEKHALSE